MFKQRKNDYLSKLNYLLIILSLGVGLTACTPSNEDPFSDFNKEYGPEYRLNKTHLFVNWQGNAQQEIAPLKLKIPLPYLMNSVGEKGEIIGFLWALEPWKKGKIDTIYLKIRRSNGQPVPYVSPDKTDDPEITKKQKEIYSDEYVVQIFRDIKGDVLNRNRDCCNFDNELFRGGDQSGLEHYIEMKCYDIQVLEKEAKSSRDDATYQNIVKKLANKKSYDITPANCLATGDAGYWVSPLNTPLEKVVKISYAPAGYRLRFVYKGRLVTVNGTEIVKNWKYYHQQVTQLLDSMLVQ